MFSTIFELMRLENPVINQVGVLPAAPDEAKVTHYGLTDSCLEHKLTRLRVSMFSELVTNGQFIRPAAIL